MLYTFSIIACLIYLYIGLYALAKERRSRINRLFMVFCTGMAIWSFGYAFVYLTQLQLWMKISAIGWCTYSSIALHLVLLFTENRIIEKRGIKVLLYFPSALFLFMSIFLFGDNMHPSEFVSVFFNIGDFIYNLSFQIISIVLVVVWGRRPGNIRRNKQAKIVVISSIIPVLLTLINQTILPVMGFSPLPSMGHIYSLVTVIGVYYAMIKYKLFVITSKLLVDEILQEMMDLVIVISPEGKIVKVNNSTKKLLGYAENELLEKPLESVLKQEDAHKVLKHGSDSDIFSLSNLCCITREGNCIPVNITCSPIWDRIVKERLGTVIVGQDITLVKKLEKEIEEHHKAEEYILYMANHDSLTGLPNRKYFYQALEQALIRGKSNNESFAVMFLDLDDLKHVNDNYGHEAGDKLLSAVGERARSVIGKDEFVARIGGDEFTFIINGVDGIDAARKAAENISKAINSPINIRGKAMMVSSSIGVSVFPDDGTDISILIKKADDGMYSEKRRKKNEGVIRVGI